MPDLNPEEMIRPIPEFEGLYSVTSHGRVWSHRRHKWMKSSLGKKGYPRLGLFRDGVQHFFQVHQLVARTFLVSAEGMEVHHKDFDRTNNHIENLIWVTHEENVQYSKSSARLAKGERHPRSFLTAEVVISIRELYSTGDYTYQQLADQFGLKRGHVAKILTDRLWKHLKEVA